MTCECGEKLTAEAGQLDSVYRAHQKTHEPLTQAHWSEAYHRTMQAKDKAKKEANRAE